jgi:hypothetical protein
MNGIYIAIVIYITTVLCRVKLYEFSQDGERRCKEQLHQPLEGNGLSEAYHSGNGLTNQEN